MKKVFLFLGAAAIIGVGSAFTTQMMDPPALGTYVLIGDTWEPAEEHQDKECVNLPGICSYTMIDDEPGSQEDPYKNPSNFVEGQPGQLL